MTGLPSPRHAAPPFYANADEQWDVWFWHEQMGKRWRLYSTRRLRRDAVSELDEFNHNHPGGTAQLVKRTTEWEPVDV